MVANKQQKSKKSTSVPNSRIKRVTERRRKSREHLRARVLKSLSDDKWDYRTAQGIAKELRVSIEEVNQLITSDPTIRKSVMRDNKGQNLYTTKKRKSALSDYISAFKAINSAKMGG